MSLTNENKLIYTTIYLSFHSILNKDIRIYATFSSFNRFHHELFFTNFFKSLKISSYSQELHFAMITNCCNGRFYQSHIHKTDMIKTKRTAFELFSLVSIITNSLKLIYD